MKLNTYKILFISSIVLASCAYDKEIVEPITEPKTDTRRGTDGNVDSTLLDYSMRFN